MRRKLIISSLIVCLFLFYVFLHQRDPHEGDIYRITEPWTMQVTDVLAIEQIDDDWFVFFRTSDFLHLGRLEKNLFGTWDLVDFHQGEALLGSIPIEETDSNVVLGGAGYSDAGSNENKSFFFGMIDNPAVNKVIVEQNENLYEITDFITGTHQTRLFLRMTDEELLSFSITAYDHDGTIVHSYPQ
ncbi:hypothetical protein [Halalkalibacter oceani]|uniref:hypothetical protein n=1 Tax=Halalkalibacter oceani TaxID=1653776 RepID=UPI0033939D54